jgi:hypothetical protein
MNQNWNWLGACVLVTFAASRQAVATQAIPCSSNALAEFPIKFALLPAALAHIQAAASATIAAFSGLSHAPEASKQNLGYVSVQISI